MCTDTAETWDLQQPEWKPHLCNSNVGDKMRTELWLRPCWCCVRTPQQSKKRRCEIRYLYNALPPIVARLEKTLRSVMLSGHDWMFRKPEPRRGWTWVMNPHDTLNDHPEQQAATKQRQHLSLLWKQQINVCSSALTSPTYQYVLRLLYSPLCC